MTRLSTSLERVLLAGTALAAFTLAGCSDTAGGPARSLSPDGSSLDKAPPEFADDNGKKFFRPKDYNDKNADNGARVRPNGGGTGISYHGGSVLQSGTKVAAIYWASSPIYTNGPTPGTAGAGSADGSLIGHFLRNLGGSPYFKINSTYTDGSGRAISSAVSYTQYWANNAGVPAVTASVSDADMVAMLQSGFNSGKLTYDAGTLYAIFTAGKTNLGGGFGTQYCAYHYHATVTINGQPKTVLYAAMPYNNAYPSGCSMGSPANGSYDPGADAEVNTLGHEIEETTTDMLGNAWFDNRGYENADKCAWTFGATYTTSAGGTANMNLGGKNFLVQQNWINAGNGGCTLSYP